MRGNAAVKRERVPPTYGVDIAPRTGPLVALAGRNVLVLADMENLIYGARDLEFVFDYRMLADILDRSCRSTVKHAFFSRAPGDMRLTCELAWAGWLPHPVDVQHVRSCRGVQRRANSDNAVLFYAGHLAAVDADLVILASGDGDLVCDAARHLRELRRNRPIASLSLAGSTSHRLDCQSNVDIAMNIEIGMDCLRRSGGGTL